MLGIPNSAGLEFRGRKEERAGAASQTRQRRWASGFGGSVGPSGALERTLGEAESRW